MSSPSSSPVVAAAAAAAVVGGGSGSQLIMHDDGAQFVGKQRPTKAKKRKTLGELNFYARVLGSIHERAFSPSWVSQGNRIFPRWFLFVDSRRESSWDDGSGIIPCCKKPCCKMERMDTSTMAFFNEAKFVGGQVISDKKEGASLEAAMWEQQKQANKKSIRQLKFG
jgi:hypothetical protein